MACACAWWVSAVGVGATTGVVTVTMPSYKLQVIQVTTGKRLRGWTYSGRLPPCGAERISGVFVCARAPRPPLEGVGARMALSPGRPVVYSTASSVRIAKLVGEGGLWCTERVGFSRKHPCAAGAGGKACDVAARGDMWSAWRPNRPAHGCRPRGHDCRRLGVACFWPSQPAARAFAGPQLQGFDAGSGRARWRAADSLQQSCSIVEA